MRGKLSGPVTEGERRGRAGFGPRSGQAASGDWTMADEQAALPLNDWHAGRGARMVPFAGYAMPIQYEGIIAEHRWTRESAGLFDVSHMGQLVVTGADAEKGLEGQMAPGFTHP